jgi:Na+-transporting NADH:ubiquinone oxidoreductase subunit C
MKQNGFYAKRIYPLVFMLAVTVVCILITSGLYLATEERVLNNELLFLRRAVLAAAGLGQGSDPDTLTRLFVEMVQEKERYYEVNVGNGSTQYVVPFAGAGLWGEISLMVGFKDDLRTLTGVAIVSQNETPGLGARIEEPWFTSQFIGKQGPFKMVEEGTADALDEIDAITGATRTSESFQSIMNRAISNSQSIIRGQ